ncbi:MAG: sugar phosphate isomerase/epimerase [Clostridia bacterium]|nr:sugar phosphate isomerase/epimerase [Clostridia bacterium]
MKLCIDFGEPLEKLGLQGAAKAVKAAGFDGVDFPFKEKKARKLLECEHWRENARRIRQTLDENGLACAQAHAPYGFSGTEKPDETSEKFRLIARSFEFAAILGAKIVVVHAVSDIKPVDFLPFNLRFYKALEKYAKAQGIKIGVENIYRFDQKFHRFDGVFETSEKMTSFLQKLRSNTFTACLDTGHAKLTGTAPEKYILGMNASNLGALHLHDNDGVDDLHALPMTGVLDWGAILAALKRIGYRGDLTFELPYYFGGFSAEELPDGLLIAGGVAKAFQEKLLS